VSRETAARARDERQSPAPETPSHVAHRPHARKRYGIRFEALEGEELERACRGWEWMRRYLSRPFTRWYATERARDEAMRDAERRSTERGREWDSARLRRRTSVGR
jgi:hypothetical protein